jgi:XTP/dITP diphosphohydrolase
MRKVWAALEEREADYPRLGAFSCTICIAWPDGHDEIFDGIVKGEVVWPMRGTHGFGFDPMFQPLGYSKTFGEMDPAQKHAMSHRADAFAKLIEGCLD